MLDSNKLSTQAFCEVAMVMAHLTTASADLEKSDVAASRCATFVRVATADRRIELRFCLFACRACVPVLAQPSTVPDVDSTEMSMVESLASSLRVNQDDIFGISETSSTVPADATETGNVRQDIGADLRCEIKHYLDATVKTLANVEFEVAKPPIPDFFAEIRKKLSHFVQKISGPAADQQDPVRALEDCLPPHHVKQLGDTAAITAKRAGNEEESDNVDEHLSYSRVVDGFTYLSANNAARLAQALEMASVDYTTST